MIIGTDLTERRIGQIERGKQDASETGIPAKRVRIRPASHRSDLNKMMVSRKDFRTAQARWVAGEKLISPNRCAMKNGIVTVLAGAVMAVLATTVSAAEPTQVERVQAAIHAWLAARAPIEKVTGIAAYISFGAAAPAIEAFAGKVGRDPDAGPVNQDTLFQMGSTSKSFNVAVILKLEAAGKLSIDDTLGKWLAEYPAWKGVSIRSLLDMTSGIPNYSETKWMSRAWEKEPMRAFTLKELVDAAYPSPANQLPVTKGYHYSNTNYILTALIAEKATGKSFTDLVHEMVIEPYGLNATFYEANTYPEPVIGRLAHGYFEN